MGVSTDGMICFGIDFGEETDFPWQVSDYEEIEEWWLVVKNYKPSVEIYDENGNYIGDKATQLEVVRNYYKERHDFLEKNPVPVDVVTYCSYDCPMYVLAVPGTLKIASRGDAVELDEFQIDHNKLVDFYAFFTEFGIDIDDKKVTWYLTSLWG